MSDAPNPREDVPGALLPALADYEDDEDRPEGDMDTAETGDIMDETRDQMDVEAGNSKNPEYCKEGSFTGRQQLNSSEESLTFKAREFIAKTKKQNLGGGGFQQLSDKKHSCGPSSLLRSNVQGKVTGRKKKSRRTGFSTTVFHNQSG